MNEMRKINTWKTINKYSSAIEHDRFKHDGARLVPITVVSFFQNNKQIFNEQNKLETVWKYTGRGVVHENLSCQIAIS